MPDRKFMARLLVVDNGHWRSPESRLADLVKAAGRLGFDVRDCHPLGEPAATDASDDGEGFLKRRAARRGRG